MFLGVLGLTGAVFFLAHRALGAGAAAERAADYPAFAWMIVLGVRLSSITRKTAVTPGCDDVEGRATTDWRTP